MTHSEIYDIFERIASDFETLELVETTKGTNGYPKHISYALIAKYSDEPICWDEITQQFCDIKLKKVILHKCDGWHFWESKGETKYDFFDIEEIYDQDGWTIISPNETSQQDLVNNLIVGLHDNLGDYQNFYEVERQLKLAVETAYALESCDGDLGEFVAIKDSVIETPAVNPRRYQLDTHHYAIGLILA